MATGRLRAVVCTSSLDLGVDWGDVDLVINVGAPKGASRLLQRIGRANHRLDEPSKGMIVPGNRFEYLEAQAALDAIGDELVSDSLVYRYNVEASPDGLRGSEGTFSLCTFDYVSSLARAGQLDKARETFEKMLTYANHVGLYSEEIALTGEQIGNFPQAFTHLAMIDAAVTLDAALDRGRP